MMTYEQVLRGKNTWASVLAVLTNELITKYKCSPVLIPRTISDGSTVTLLPIRSKGSAVASIISADHTAEININYSNSVKEYIENVYPLRRMAKDVIYDIPSDMMNIANTLPIVHGISCFPSVRGTRLLAENGGRYSRNKRDTGRGHILVDFTPIGGAEFIKLSNCSGSWDMFQLPTGKTMTDKFVILVVEGRWYFPGEYTVIDTNKIAFNLNGRNTAQHNLDRSLTSYNYLKNTTQLSTSSSLAALASTEDSFLILINNSEIQVQYSEPIYQIGKGLLKFPLQSGGLLMERSSRAMIDYTRVHYKDHSTVWIPNIVDIKMPKSQASAIQDGFTKSNWEPYEDARKLDPSYIMIDLIDAR